MNCRAFAAWRGWVLGGALLLAAWGAGCGGERGSGPADGGDGGRTIDGGADGTVAEGGPGDAGDDGGGGPGEGGMGDGGGVGPGPDLPEPGGPRSRAPVVGCNGAERPARRLASVEPVCEAVGGGRCWYVSPEGSDMPDGSFARPFAVPQEAVRRAGPGDVVYLRGGVYGEANAHVSSVPRWGDPSAGVNRGLLTIRRVSLPGWAGGESYAVRPGTEEAPILVRSFPGERACSDGAGGIRIGESGMDGVDMAYWRIEGITLVGAPIEIGGGSGNAAMPINQVHDIMVRYNEVFAYVTPGGGNPGLVRVNRGDGGGPYEIRIQANILHDLVPIDPDGVQRDWSTTNDTQHFGAVTTLSCETYLGPGCGGNGSVYIEGNHIYRVPQAFFFKNPARGPVVIQGNVVHDIRALGQWSPSNILLENNLFHGGAGLARIGGTGGPVEDEVFERLGHNLTVRNNTFVGFDQVIEFRIFASGHTIHGNVVQGLAIPYAERGWNNMGFVFQAQSWIRPDTAARIEDSQLARDNDFDDNCFVTPVEDFLAYGRRRRTDSGTDLTHLTLAQARERLGFDVASDRVDDPSAVFEDFAAGNYRVRSDGPCAGRGAEVPDWALPDGAR